jgi:hypothetical protein
MSILQKALMRQVAPMLNKITDGINAMAKEYDVEKCVLMISGKTNPKTGKEEAYLTFMSVTAGKLDICRDKNGNIAEFPIEKLPELLSGGINEDED